MGVCVSVREQFRNGLTCVQIRFVLSVTVIGEEAVLAWTATTALNGPRFRYKLRGELASGTRGGVEVQREKVGSVFKTEN